MIYNALIWLSDVKIPDVVTYLGFVITVGGFYLTIASSRTAREAAERAEKAAIETQKRVRAFDTAAEISAARTYLEDIVRILLGTNLDILSSQLSKYRQIVVSVKTSNVQLEKTETDALTTAISNIDAIQQSLAKERSKGSVPKRHRFEKALHEDLDKLTEILTRLRHST